MTLREAIQAVYNKHGELTPALIVEEARRGRSEAAKLLKGRLEWDDAVAGEAHRRHQAHELIRSVRVVYREASEHADELSIRAFHSVRRETGHVYEPTERVTSDPFLQRLVLNDMEREWRALKDRYERFREFTDMVRQDLGEAA